jgi:hypothetical protein
LIETLGLICCTWDDPRGIMRMFEQDTIHDFDYLCFFDGKFEQWQGVEEFPVSETHDIVKDFGDTNDVNVYYELVEGKTEAEKRNYMFARAYDIGMDWGLVVDSDEIPYINKHEWNKERPSLSDSEFGCHSVILNNYNLIQRRPRLFNMREKPYLLQNESSLSHDHVYSSRDGRDMTVDITKTKYDVKSITLEHDKEFHSKYRWNWRHEFAKIKNH